MHQTQLESQYIHTHYEEFFYMYLPMAQNYDLNI